MNAFQVSEAWDGFQSVRGSNRFAVERNQQVLQLMEVLENKKGNRLAVWAMQVQEAMGQGRFPILFGDIIDRQMLQSFQSAPRIMSPLMRMANLGSMREVRRYKDEGYSKRFEEVEENAEYQGGAKSHLYWTYAPKKYGRKFEFSLEEMLNDDMGFFTRLPQDLAQGAINTEDWFLTSMFFGTAGPLDSFFRKGTAYNGTTYGQNAVSQLVLSEENLGIAIAEMMGSGTNSSSYRSKDGEPILNSPRYLMVPPALELRARQILNSASLIVSGPITATSTATTQGSLNVISQLNLQLKVNPWMPVVITSGTIGHTSWSLFSETVNPGELGKVSGRSEPEVFLQSANAVRVGGGGEASPFDGSFANDSIAYKCRYIFGGTPLDPRGGWASKGQ